MIVGVNPQFPIVTHNIINTHFFHGNIWTHNWPAPNVSGFIAQLLEHRTGKIARSVTGSNPVEVLNFFQASLRNCINCVHCDDHFFIFISFPQFICDLFHISLTLCSIANFVFSFVLTVTISERKVTWMPEFFPLIPDGILRTDPWRSWTDPPSEIW